MPAEPKTKARHTKTGVSAVPSYRRTISYLACLAALVAVPASALAKAHATHAKKVTGVVVSINARHHTLKLRVHHAAAARVADTSSGRGGSLVSFSFGEASVNGGDGAVAIGDDVTITETGGTGSVAASIDVIGQPNGGDAGKGAAIPGTVMAVDSTAGTLTISTGSSMLDVSVNSATVLAIPGAGDANAVTLADVHTGDHVVVFTDDATATPVVAIGILDSGAPAAPETGSGDPAPATTTTGLGGTVQSVDLAGGTVTVLVAHGPLEGDSVPVTITTSTKLEDVGGATGAPFTLADIHAGDRLSISTDALSANGVVAIVLYDGGPATGSGDGSGSGSGDGSGDGSGSGSGSGATSPSGDTGTTKFAATVTNVGSDGLTVTVDNGPLAGQSVRVRVTSTTSFMVLTTITPVADLASDVSVGDTVEVYTQSESTTPITAVGLIDYGVVSDS